jgi:predicted alpha/beta-fold hydrolase
LQSFHPLVRNPHLLTLLGNYWPRRLDVRRFPPQRRIIATEPDVRVLVISQRPQRDPHAQLVLVHGLEGSSESGYNRSLAQCALEAGYAVHRFNMRSCGGTEHLAVTNYHAGQTADLQKVLRVLRAEFRVPLFLTGFSLGGNVALKLAGELGEAARDLLAGVCSVSTPIDLALCVERLEHWSNYLYARRFLSRLKQRMRRRAREAPERYSIRDLKRIRTVYEFDDVYTARFFGFGTAAHYYGTQSAKNFLDSIRIPALFVQAQDDPLAPFAMYDHPAFRTNPNLTLIAPQHGGHLGFISRGERFWLDRVLLSWMASVLERDFHTAPRDTRLRQI